MLHLMLESDLHRIVRQRIVDLVREEVNVKGKICFIVLSVILAVSIGYTSDISAYTYRTQSQGAARVNEVQTRIVTSSMTIERSDNRVDTDELRYASETVDTIIADAIRNAQPSVTESGLKISTSEGYLDPVSQQSEGADASGQASGETSEETSETASQTVTSEETQTAEQESESSIEEAEAEEVVYEYETEDQDLYADQEQEEEVYEQNLLTSEEPYFNPPAFMYGGSEVEVLQKIVMAEAGSEDLQGQIMVANVILNRVAAGFGGSISEVVFAPGQFEPVSTGTYYSAVPSDSVIEAVNRALAGEDYSFGALYFVSPLGDTSWFYSDCTLVTEHGGHLFFR